MPGPRAGGKLDEDIIARAHRDSQAPLAQIGGYGEGRRRLEAQAQRACILPDLDLAGRIGDRQPVEPGRPMHGDGIRGLSYPINRRHHPGDQGESEQAEDGKALHRVRSGVGRAITSATRRAPEWEMSGAGRSGRVAASSRRS